MARKVVVLGSSFAGMTAAIEMQRRGDDYEVVVVSKSAELLFHPSLIWVPFGLRERKDITFDVGVVLEQKGIRFVHAEVTAIDAPTRTVCTSQGDESYDHLVIATGAELAWDEVPGLGPKHGRVHSIMTFDQALAARYGWESFLGRRGPIVIGAVQGADSFGAAYELLFNTAHHLQKRKLLGKVPLTFVSPEPFPGHFGTGGFGAAQALIRRHAERLGIELVMDVGVERIEPGRIVLEGGRELPFAFAVLVPATRGTRAVRTLGPELLDARGFVKVDGTYRIARYPEIYAVGGAMSLPPRTPTRVPCGVPRTGHASEEMARIAVHNIVADVQGYPPLSIPAGALHAKWVLDAGDTGLLMTADRLLPPRDHAWLIPGPEAHWAKIAFEKYFMATHRRGLV